MSAARKLAAQYRLVIEQDAEGDGFLGCTVEMPGVMGGGDDLAACVKDTLEATAASIALILESGDTPPAPAREGKRDQQVNIRITAEERLTLESLANREGFRSVSDYVRSTALGRTPLRR
ncbi:MAG: hypothetical protein JNL50_00315 [Phycisphaerae bacterium]|nr:hypothetical protein [Phycisphaerae bacterium]